MAWREFIEGKWSRQYEYVEICRDDYSCRKKFKLREEEDLADAYYNHLQSLDDQANTFREQKCAADEQKRAVDELEALRKVTEEKSRRDREYFRNPFSITCKTSSWSRISGMARIQKSNRSRICEMEKSKSRKSKKSWRSTLSCYAISRTEENCSQTGTSKKRSRGTSAKGGRGA